MTYNAAEYETTTITYSDLVPQVVDTADIGGVTVDILRHVYSNAANLDSAPDPIYADQYDAVKAGTYELEPAVQSFYVNANDRHVAGAPAGGGRSRAKTDRVLGRSTTIKGAISAARRALAADAIVEQYGDLARRNVRTVGGTEFADLPADATIEPGDLVAVWGHGSYRQGIATKVTGTKTHLLFSTPSGGGHLTNGSGRTGVEVRLVRKARAVAAQPELPIVEQVEEPAPGTPIGQMTPAQQRVAVARATSALQAELTSNAPALSAALSAPLPGEGDEECCPDPECGEPLAAIESGAVGHCGRECGPPLADEPDTDDPFVWVFVWRRGADYHDITDGAANVGCGRPTNIGTRVRLSEAVDQLASTRCPRCIKWADAPTVEATIERPEPVAAGLDSPPVGHTAGPVLVGDGYPLVLVRQALGVDPYKPAELRQTRPSGSVAQVVYLGSRTSAWVAVERIETRFCRVCHCTEDNACPGGCAWASEDLCTACVPSGGGTLVAVNTPDEPNPATCGAVVDFAALGLPDQAPCMKAPGHEHGPGAKAREHSNGLLHWPVRAAGKAAALTDMIADLPNGVTVHFADPRAGALSDAWLKPLSDEPTAASVTGWPPQAGDVWRDTSLGVTWHTRLDDQGRTEFYEPGGPGHVSADDLPAIRGGMVLRERPDPVVEDVERCSRCGEPIGDNLSDQASDDLCRDCRFEEDADKPS